MKKKEKNSGKSTNDAMKNKYKYALVTGATSGIGYEVARRLASEGYNLLLVARDEERLREVAGEFGEFGITVTPVSKDLFDPGAAREIYEYTKGMGISPEILVNDAGQGEYGKFAETDLQRQLDIIQLNVNSLVSLTYYYLHDMLSRNSGRILQLGSEVSKVPMPLMSVYAASKAFVLSFTEALVNELEGTGVTMTLLMPGTTDTDFFDKAGMEDTKIYREGKLEAPEDVADAAVKAMLAGERRVISSNAKLNVAMAAVTPDDVNAKKLRKQLRPSEKSRKETRQQPVHRASRKAKQKAASKK
jgi:uncharacterized protein